MSGRGFARRLFCGLGILAGAFASGEAAAQVPDTARTRRDTVQRDSIRVAVPARPTADTLLRDTLAARGEPVVQPAPVRDTIKAPLARAELPLAHGMGAEWAWDRAALFATGAVTVQDLLERIPGVTGFRTGWIAAPMTVAWMGQPGRVRVYLDGVALDLLDTRDPAVIDLSQVGIWMLEELRVERAATELRVHMRSWRVDRTTAFTRADVSTGDQETNLYRAFFGRRYRRGEALQVAAQQYGTTSLSAASSDQTSLMARTGVARGRWSADVFALRTGRHRGVIQQFAGDDSIPAIESSRTDAYVRGAWGDPEGSGAWAQAIAVAQVYDFEGSEPPRLAGDTTPVPPRDTARSQAQYILSGGASLAGVRASAAARLRVRDGRTLFTPQLRASGGRGWLSVAAFAEGRGADSASRADASVSVTPFGIFGVFAAAGRSELRAGGASTPTTYALGEAGVRLGRLWLLAGVLRRDSTTVQGWREVDSAYVARPEADALTYTAAVRGAIWKDLRADIWAAYTPDSGMAYRPRYQTRSEIFVRTNWLTRFPSGNFGLLASVLHEYRSAVAFPTSTGVLATNGHRIFSTQLEIRVLQGVAFWHFRNALGEIHYQVPGYLQPRQTQAYGVRWEFWN